MTNLSESAKRIADRTADSGEALGGRAAEMASSVAQGAQRRVGHAADAVREAGDIAYGAAQSVGRELGERPLTLLAAGLGLGYLIAYLIHGHR